MAENYGSLKKQMIAKTDVNKDEFDVFQVDEVDLVLERDFYIVGKNQVLSSQDAYDIFKQFWNTNLINIQEQMSVMLLNQNNNVIGMYQHSKGSINATVADKQLIVAVAIKSLAKGVVVAHNHPSGNLNPSKNDIDLTHELKRALGFFGIKLLDSLIISGGASGDGYRSLYDTSILEDGGEVDSGGYMAKGGGISKGGMLSFDELDEINKDLVKSKGFYVGDKIKFSIGEKGNLLFPFKERNAQIIGFIEKGKYKDLYVKTMPLKGLGEGETIDYNSIIDKMSDGGYMAKGGEIEKIQRIMEDHKDFSLELYPNGEMAIENGFYGVKVDGKLKNTIYIGTEFYEVDGVVYKEDKEGNSKKTNLKMADGGVMAKGGEINVKGKSIKLKYVKRCCPGIKNDGTIGNYQYDFVDEMGNPFIGYGNSKEEALKDIEEYQNRFASGGYMADGVFFAKGGAIKRHKPIMVEKAYKLGQKAFLEGKKCIPYHDAELNELIKSETDRSAKQYINYADSWLKGWTRENLKNPVPDDIDNKMAMGGKVTFEDKVKAIKSSLLKRKKVSPKVQKDYGKTYSPKEAEHSAKRIVGSQVARKALQKLIKKRKK